MKTNNKRRLLLKLFAVILAVQMLLSFTGCELQNHLNDKIYRDAWYKIYVSTTGNDSNPGTWQKPLKTLEKARDTVRTLSAGMQGNIEVILRQGEYTLDKTFALTEADSGRNGYKIIYKSQEGEKVVLSGGKSVTGWSVYDSEKGIYKAEFGGPIETRQLYVNGVRAVRAKSNTGLTNATYDANGHTTTDTFLASFKNISDLEMVYKQNWTNPRCPVESISVSGGTATVKMQQPGWTWCRSKGTWTAVTNPWYYENAYELLDEEGEWYLDRTGSVGGKAYTFYYKPRRNEDMSKAQVTVPVLEELLTVKGADLDHPVKDLAFSGITFSYATWNHPSTDDGHADAQNNVLREDYDPNNPKYTLSDYQFTDKMTGGNVVLSTAIGVNFTDCTFTKLGNTALFMRLGSQDNLVQGCAFYDISGGGIQVGEVDMYNPDNFMPTDERYLMRNNDIINNYIHHIGVEYRSATGIALGFVTDSDVLHNEIGHVPYSGIHFGWGWQRIMNLGRPCVQNNRIEYNYIHDILTELYDGGGIYALGPHSDTGNRTIIANNFIQRQMSNFAGIYLDEACDYYSVYNNVIDTAPQWVCSKHVLNDIHDNYTNQSALINDPHLGQGEKAVIRNTTVVENGNWPEAAEAIMKAAGPTEEYKHLLPVSGNVSFDLSGIDSMKTISFTLGGVRNLTAEKKVRMYFDGGEKFAGVTLSVNGEPVTTDSGGFAWLSDPYSSEDIGKLSMLSGITASVTGDFPSGKNSITVGLAEENKTVLFKDSISVITGYEILLNEDYEDTAVGAVPKSAVYDSTLGSALVQEDEAGNKVLKIDHSKQSPSASLLVQYNIPPTSGIVSVSFKVKPTGTKAAIYAPYIRSGQTEIVTVNLHNNGYFAINKPPVEYLKTYTANTWYTVNVIMDTELGTFNLYVDGVLLKKDVALKSVTETVDNVCIGMYRYDTGYYFIDDLLIKTAK